MDLAKKLRDALIRRARGYEYQEEKMVGKNGAQRVEIIRKHVPADIAAIKHIQFLMSIGKWEE